MTLNLRPAILALSLFVCMIIYLAAFNIADVVVLALGGCISFYRSHAIPLLPLLSFPSPVPSVTLEVSPTLNISEDIMNIV